MGRRSRYRSVPRYPERSEDPLALHLGGACAAVTRRPGAAHQGSLAPPQWIWPGFYDYIHQRRHAMFGSTTDVFSTCVDAEGNGDKPVAVASDGYLCALRSHLARGHSPALGNYTVSLWPGAVCRPINTGIVAGTHDDVACKAPPR